MGGLGEEIATLRELLERGERGACRAGLEALRDRYRSEPAAFSPEAIAGLKALAETLAATPGLEAALKATFGYDGFRPGQREI